MQQYRPDNHHGDSDGHLAGLAKDLFKLLRETQKSFGYDSLRLRKPELADLAEILVEFGEDIHNHIGIWNAYEQYNLEFFGCRLPFASMVQDGAGITFDRVRHLLWVLYPELIPGLIISPRHQDMEAMAEVARLCLDMAFKRVPKGSGVKAFLESPNEVGWEVKRKLVWLGTKSYLFRLMCRRYLADENRGRWDIGHVDDFLCQECTRWSGLGVLDILAGVLDISPDDRRDLRSWYERHASFYQIKTANDEYLEVLNVISDEPYRVRIDMPGHPFRRGHLVFGSLVPWRGEWYWSGQQQKWDSPAGMDVSDLRKTMKQKSSQIVCRFWKEYESQVRERAEAIHEAALAYHGKDLVVYPDGLAMAADWEKELRMDWESRSAAQIQEVIRRHGLGKGRPNMSIPPHLLQHKNGIGVFLHPVEGKEIMCEFRPLVEGLKRRGEGLSEEQEDAILQFITLDGISPAFVRRMLDEHGAASVKTVFRIPDDVPDYWLEYLLRRHKGKFYRNRYPAVSVV